MLMSYRWPGNVRELENMIERLMIITSGDTIRLEHMSEMIVNNRIPVPNLIPSDIPDEGLNLEALLENAEKTLFKKRLKRPGGVKTEAAKLLGLSFRSFRHRLQKYESS